MNWLTRRGKENEEQLERRAHRARTQQEDSPSRLQLACCSCPRVSRVQGPCGPSAFLQEALSFWTHHSLGSSALDLFIFFKKRKCLD